MHAPKPLHLGRAATLKNRIRVLLVLVCLAGIYTNLSMPIGEGRLYGAPGVFSGIALLVMRLPKARSFYRLFLWFALLLAIVIGFGPDVVKYGGASALSTVQLLLAITASFGLANELIQWRTAAVRQLAFWSAAAVCVLAVLEMAGPLKPVSDAFRDVLYGGEDLFVYAADARDELLHGGVRPKVFTQEPSHPAKFVAAMIITWFLLARPRRRWTVLALLFGASMLSMRSPSLALSMVVIGFVVLGKPERLVPDNRKLLRIGMVLAFVLAICTVPLWVGLLPFERAKAVVTGDDASSLMRLVAPIPITISILSDYPFFGLGMGSRDLAFTAVMEVFARYDVINLQARRAESAWSNALFQLVCYMGIVGTTLFFWWLKRLTSRIYAGDVATMLICFLAIFSAEGTFGLMRPWLYFFLLLAALYHRRQIVAENDLANSFAKLPVREKSQEEPQAIVEIAQRPFRLIPIRPQTSAGDGR